MFKIQFFLKWSTCWRAWFFAEACWIISKSIPVEMILFKCDISGEIRGCIVLIESGGIGKAKIATLRAIKKFEEKSYHLPKRLL